jgi:nicotinamide-nucleotide amidase
LTEAQTVIELLTARRQTVAVAESLTGGLVVAELISVPGASAVVRGGVVAYATPLKHSLLGVDAALLAEHGPVHAEVAAEMAEGVRETCAVDGIAADYGISTTGVAGPDSQDGKKPGTVFLGISSGAASRGVPLALSGTREEIRTATVQAILRLLIDELTVESE